MVINPCPCRPNVAGYALLVCRYSRDYQSADGNSTRNNCTHLMGFSLASSSCSSFSSASRLASASPRVLHHRQPPFPKAVLPINKSLELVQSVSISAGYLSFNEAIWAFRHMPRCPRFGHGGQRCQTVGSVSIIQRPQYAGAGKSFLTGHLCQVGSEYFSAFQELSQLRELLT